VIDEQFGKGNKEEEPKMSKDFWEEVDDILAKEENRIYPSPLWIDLTPNGKTLIVLYPGKHQEEIAEAIIDKLGEPEEAGPSEDYPGNLLLLFPHQDLPEPVKDVAERMTTYSLLQSLTIDENPLEHIRCYKLDGVSVMDPELAGFDSIIVNTIKPFGPGDLVFGLRENKPTVWRYSENEQAVRIVGLVTSSSRCLRH
jgi:hypothetical protein